MLVGVDDQQAVQQIHPALGVSSEVSYVFLQFRRHLVSIPAIPPEVAAAWKVRGFG